MEQINYPLIIIVVIAAVILLVWMIRRNLKDEKDYEKETMQSEIKPEKHNRGEDKP
ncbi:hypothetical protein LX99_03635 [Mucilaginibacter oryzae]|uniref:Uncharacterized protein n=1 Tax=Mucilaginibacter oryzae TaxID=468058 RepID=A0A316HLU3_9SPHI|nr:hypothetical protein [Mucilaginibacter oryzae]PWK75902.1 hypothetical protein LX99_03635 [Mucilaginibacter oryzae]